VKRSSLGLLFAALAAALLLVAAGRPVPAVAQATVPVSPDEVVRGDPSRPNVALVLNVGAGYTPADSILDTLREKDFRATFFVLGWWADSQPELLGRIAADGHEVASHGHSVFDLTQVSDDEVRADLEAADASIAAVTGRTTRPLWSPSAGYRDQRVREIAASLGYRPIYWTVDSGDWTFDATAEGVYQRVMPNMVNGAIVVLHFDSPNSATATAVALPRLIDDLRAQGYRLVTVTQLLTDEGA
jgi:peptidoglycan/xylan/chitin deacetylase (PgdA/CDA1 family)